ncbi:30S ribosomal protein S16 [Candidatus Saccharibacteria bacterium]|nr:30S ribosomal protein S16 [Candidatus Saccharibacteria bacterium]
MLAIRLQRNGRSGYPVYRIVVQEANRHPLSGRIVSQVGSYNPHTKEVVLDKENAEKYLKNGAQPSSRVIRILEAEGIKMPDWVKKSPAKATKTKNAEKLRKNQPKEAPVAEETPTNEVPAEEAAPIAEADGAVETPTAEAAPTEAPAEA